jgi:WD domain, G-beta repeat
MRLIGTAAPRAFVTGPIAAGIAAVLLTSCLYVPSIGGKNPSEETLLFLQPRNVRKEEVLHRFGPPNALHDSRFFVYDWSKGKGALIVWNAGMSLGKNYARLLCEFDSVGYLVRYVVARASYSATMTAMKYKPIEPGGPRPEQEPAPVAPEIADSRGEGIVLRGSKSFEAVAYSPDGNVLAAADRNGDLWVRNNETGEIRKLPRSAQSGRKTRPIIQFSPDGGIMLALARGIRLFETGTWQELRPSSREAPARDAIQAMSAALSPKGLTILVGGTDGSLRLLDAQRLVTLRTIRAHRKGIHDVSYSPDGHLAASAGRDDLVKIWNTDAWVELAAMKARVGAIRFLPDGRLALSRTGWVEIWKLTREAGDVPRGRIEIDDVFLVPCFDTQLLEQSGLALTADGTQIAAVTDCGTCQTYDLKRRAPRWAFLPEKEKDFKYLVKAWAYAPDGRSVAVASAEGVSLWKRAVPDSPSH